MTDTSGPAFPVILRRDNGGDQFVGQTETWATGLSRRELFAAMAMQGLLAGGAFEVPWTAEWSLKHADALLAELAKGGKA